MRLEYRYLDLRKDKMRENLVVRHKIFTETLKFFDKE
ncbi:hypothetical protein J5751_07110 [bacterium]|nr:hypothetical protein [bacterium]